MATWYNCSASSGTTDVSSAYYSFEDNNTTVAASTIPSYSNYYITGDQNDLVVDAVFQQQEFGSQIFYGSVGSFPFNKEVEERLKKAQDRAEELKGMLMPKEQLLQLEMENRVEIIAKNGGIYEILKDGRVNKLLKNGKKQGLCIYPKHGPYPVADEILAKKALLEADPDKFEEIANKVAAFPLAS